jgi:uncharacterized protein YjiK
MRFLNFQAKRLALFSVAALLLAGCKSKTRTFKSPPNYNFGKVYTYKLDETKLLEISGIAYDTKHNEYLAIQDESNRLFFLDKENLTVKESFEFGAVADYEEVALYKGAPFILQSNGTIFKFLKDSTTGKAFSIEVGESRIGGEKDFEAMYADTARKALVVICKNCGIDDENSVSAFAFYPDSIGYDDKPLYTINAKRIRELSPKKTSKFQPSGAAIHPKTNELYIVSSASNQLAIADLDGNVKNVYHLSSKMFPQPEGITFRSDGDMCISNEGLRGSRKPTLLKFEYMPLADSAKAKQNKSGYDFSKPTEKMELGKDLHEISGMAYIPDQNVILSENDEKGSIFKVDFQNKKENVGKVKFGGKGDYEDIVYADSSAYILVATGAVVKVNTRDTAVASQEFTLGIAGVNEFESMYLDADGKSLILLCKDCDGEKNKIRAAYRFDPATQTFSTEPAYKIDIKSIQQLLNDDQAEFKPSAAGIHPLTGKLFIVASVGKLLVIADKNGKIEEVIQLDPVLYNQPEGLTFAPNGDLYISNEGGEGIATILKFTYKK